MYYVLAPAAALAIILAYLVLKPLVDYYRDPKGFRKYPSINALAGITNLSFMYEASKGFRSKTLAELHKVHPIIRIGPNSLSFCSIAAIKDIYGHSTKCTKDHFYSVLAGSHYHLADVVDKLEHQRKRKVLSSSYALKNLEGWEHKVADKTIRFIRACDSRCTSPLAADTDPNPKDLTFDYRFFSNLFTVEAIADIGLSTKLGFLDRGYDECMGEKMDGTKRPVRFRRALHATARAQSQLVWGYNWYKFNVWLSRLLPFTSFPHLWRLNEDWNDAVYGIARSRMARYEKGEQLDDFFQALMEDKRTGNPNNLEWGEIVAETSIMMNAGSDTTAMAMANVMLHLLHHPDVMRKLREEVDAALDPDEVVAPYDKVKHLPYLRAVLDESLRITPPTTFGLPRRTPMGGWEIDGQYIPQDTSVSVSAWVAHRNEEVFPEPEKFLPERWLAPNAKELQAAFIPFSAGARGCIGRNISYLEQTVLLASVVHRYEMVLPHKDWQPERVESFNLMMADLPVKVWRRDLGVANPGDSKREA